MSGAVELWGVWQRLLEIRKLETERFDPAAWLQLGGHGLGSGWMQLLLNFDLLNFDLGATQWDCWGLLLG